MPHRLVLPRTPRVLAALALSALTLAPAALQAQKTERAAFVVRMGVDTIAVERFTRSRSTIEGEVVTRSPSTRVVRYTASLAKDGTVSRIQVSSAPVDSAPTSVATTTFAGDSALVEVRRGDSTRTFRVAARPGTVPTASQSYALYEQLVRQVRAQKADSLSLTTYSPGAPSASSTYAVRRGADAVELGYFGSPWLARVDGAGRLVALDGSRSTFKVQVERVATVDIAALAKDFAARDAAGKGLGSLSPRDSVRATVGAAQIVIDYSRPRTRGRVIFGRVVPFDQVWRTGANAATGFTTDRDLLIGGTLVPAGSYSLFTIPTPTAWTLIINKQTRQSGTAHDPAQDLARIPMTRETLASTVETFTISIEPTAEGGVLRLAWDDTQASVPVVMKPVVTTNQ